MVKNIYIKPGIKAMEKTIRKAGTIVMYEASSFTQGIDSQKESASQRVAIVAEKINLVLTVKYTSIHLLG